MSQSRTMSAVEATANIAVGMGVAYATQLAVFPMFGLHATHSQHITITVIFTAVSFVRSYFLRRIFNRWKR